MEESQNTSEINVVDQDVTDEDVEWAEEDSVDTIREAAHADEAHYRSWKDADCRIILNVSVGSAFLTRSASWHS